MRLLLFLMLALGTGQGFCGEPAWPSTGMIVDPAGYQVKAVIVQSPADRAGIRAGDKVLRVNGAPTQAMTYSEFSKHWGPAGSKISLSIARSGVKTWEVSLTREDIPKTKFTDVHLWLARENFAPSQYALAQAYLSGDAGVEKNSGEALKWIRKAAALGEASAEYSLGSYYRTGFGVEKDAKKFVEWTRKAAEHGFAAAQYDMGYAHSSGFGIVLDPAEAFKWYRKAADQGFPAAMASVGDCYWFGLGTKKDMAQGVPWYEKAAAAGVATAQNQLGWIYQNGLGASKDIAKAIEWYGKAAEQGHVNAQLTLGALYYNGQDVPVDFAKAVYWYRKAADQGRAVAQEMLGFAFMGGNGVKQDYAEAARWFQLSSEQGLSASMSNLGWLYSMGHGIERNDQEALRWLAKAADSGDPYAMNNIGWIHETGRGVAADENEARKWYEKALEKGGNKTAAKTNLDNLNARKAAKTSAPATAPAAPAASREQLEDIVKAMLKAQREEEAKGAAVKVISSDVDNPLYKVPENPDNVAIVVGIENYPGLPAARFAGRDADAVRAHLGALGYATRNIAFLTEQQATRAGLSKTINAWLPARVNKNSTVFFYYSGHGAPDVKSGQAFLVPSDGDPEYLEDTAYPIKQLYEKLGTLKAKRVIVALDACFSGAGGRSVLAKDVRPLVTRIEGLSLAPGKIVSLSASKADQISGGLEDQGHGTFTYYLLKGLNGAAAKDEAVTVRSLYEYLKPKVEDAARLKSRDQTPQLSPENFGEARLR